MNKYMIGIAMAVSGSIAAPATALPGKATAARVKALADAADRNDCNGVIRVGQSLLRDRTADLPNQARSQLFDVVVSCEAEAGKENDAYRDAVTATALEDSSDYVWRVRLAGELTGKRYPAAMTTIEAMTNGRGAALGSVPVRWFWQLHRSLEDQANGALDMQLLKILTSSYQPNEPFAEIDAFRLIYARKLKTAGDMAEARAQTNAVTMFSGLVNIGLDPDLRPLRGSPINLEKAAEQQLEDDRALLGQHPDSLQGVNSVAEDLNRLGKYQDALATLETARAAIAKSDGFQDAGEQASWWWDSLAKTYILMGDYPHMVEAYRGGIKAGEDGGPNVSQLLNLGEDQIRFGHYTDALTTVTPQGTPPQRSPYGDMTFHFVHGCAAFKANQAGLAAQDIEYVRAHEKDGAGPATDLMLCIGDYESAAQILVRWLDNVDNRIGALRMLADYRPNSPGVPDLPGYEQLSRIKARPDVKAAAEKAGGLPKFPFKRGGL